MTALQPLRPSPRPVRHLQVVRQPVSRSVPRKQRQPHRGVALEITTKLAVNVVLSIAAVAALVQLLPYRASQQAKLGELQAEVKAAQARVDQLQADFSRHFDPSQARAIMQEQSVRVDAQRRQILLTTQDSNSAGMTPSP